MTVTMAVDGDTIHLSNGQKVRIIGLDTPETKHPSKPVQCFGREASARASALLAGKKIRVVQEPTQHTVDRYGRSLYHVWLSDGRLYAEVMIGDGFAIYYPYGGTTPQHGAKLAAAESRAKRAKVGL